MIIFKNNASRNRSFLSVLLVSILSAGLLSSCERDRYTDGKVEIIEPKTGAEFTEGELITFKANVYGSFDKVLYKFVSDIETIIWKSDKDGELNRIRYTDKQEEVQPHSFSMDNLTDGIHEISCYSYSDYDRGTLEGTDQISILVQENWDDGDDETTTTTTTTASLVDCSEYEDTCWDRCAEIETEASTQYCDTFDHYSGCALDFVGCGTVCLDYTQYWCDIPGYLACIDPVFSEHYDCVEGCNASMRATPDYGERMTILGTCGSNCSDENNSGCLCLYYTEALDCKNKTCDAYCKSKGLPGGQWVNYSVTQGMYNACECQEAGD